MKFNKEISTDRVAQARGKDAEIGAVKVHFQNTRAMHFLLKS